MTNESGTTEPTRMESRASVGRPRASLRALEGLRHRLRRLRIVDGAVGVTLAGVTLVVASFLLDYALVLPWGVRLVFLAVGFGILGRQLVERLLRPLSRPVSDRDLAVLVEDRNPELRQSLITAIELGAGGGEGARYASPELLQSVIDDVERRVGQISFERIFRLGRLLRASALLGIALAVVAGVTSTFPSHAGIWFERNVLLASVRWPKSIQLEEPVLPEAIAIGDDLPVRVRLLRGKPKVVRVLRDTGAFRDAENVMELRENGSWDVWLVASPDDVEAARARLESAGALSGEARKSLEEGSGRLARDLSWVDAEKLSGELREVGLEVNQTSYDVYFHEFKNLSDAIRFSIEGGDDQIGPYEVAVRIRPRIDMQSIRVRYRLPEYTGLENEVVEQSHGHLRVPVGTQVDYRMATNVPVVKVFFVLENDPDGVTATAKKNDEDESIWPEPGALALDIAEGRSFSGSFVVSKSGRYWFQFEDEHGFRSEKPETFRIQAIEDRKPVVRVVEPERVNEQVSPRANVKIRVAVEDDYGIRSGVIEGRYFAPGSDVPVPQSFPLTGLVPEGESTPGSAPREAECELLLEIPKLVTGSASPPEPGGRFEFFALAEDFGITGRTRPDGRPIGNVGESQVRLLEIVDTETLERIFTDRLMLVRDQLRQLDAREEALRKNLQDVEEQARLKGALSSDEAAKLSRHRQDQAKISEGLERQVAEVDHILTRMKENLVGDERLESWITQIRDDVAGLAREDSPRIERDIDELRKDAAASPAEPARLGAIAARQRQLERDLERLVLMLEEYGDINAVIQLLRGVRDRQEMIRNETRRQVEGTEKIEPSDEETTP